MYIHGGETPIHIKLKNKLGQVVAAHAFNPSTWKAEAGGFPNLKDSLGYRSSSILTARGIERNPVMKKTKQETLMLMNLLRLLATWSLHRMDNGQAWGRPDWYSTARFANSRFYPQHYLYQSVMAHTCTPSTLEAGSSKSFLAEFPGQPKYMSKIRHYFTLMDCWGGLP